MVADELGFTHGPKNIFGGADLGAEYPEPPPAGAMIG